jgi:F-type H+-transporting ATPase subunit a
VSLQLATLASEELPWPPSVEDFFLPDVAGAWVTKFTILIWLAVALIIAFFVLTQRNAKIVPSKSQWLGESVFGFVRDGVAKDVIGHDGAKFAPYLTTLFCFIAVTNLYSIIPLAQISPNSHIAFPIVLALISWAVFNVVGIRKHGFSKYMKMNLIPPGVPKALLPLLIPIEFLSTFLLRPVTLAVRLFANMFAGHLILLVFTLGGFMLFGTGNAFLAAAGVLSWGMAIALTIFEAAIAVLQAYVFVMLSASYIGAAIADEH